MRSEIKALRQWLIDGARSVTQSEDVFEQVCDGLVASGIPLWSAELFVRTPHPDVGGRNFRWRRGSGVVIEEIGYDSLDMSGLVGASFAGVRNGKTTTRLPSNRAGFGDDSPLARSLVAEGITDLLASPLRFNDGTVHVATWATRHPGGFAAEHVSAIDAIVGPATRVAEIRALRRTTDTLLKLYVGDRAGARLLAGQIRRGAAETIHAAILLSDMRGFTALTNRLPLSKMSVLLNSYFDCQVPAILGRGGEVLKFIGDGLLAIFRIEATRRGTDEACAAAAAAAVEARSRIADLASSYPTDGVVQLRFGVALHLGDILYANFGGRDRLDFTCIGPAINLAARLEKLAGALGRSIVASESFALHCRRAFSPLGRFALKGFSRKQRVYGLTEQAREDLAAFPGDG